MACEIVESSSSSRMVSKYDVFVSFRGEDARNSFTDILFGLLHQKSIVTFRDNKNINKGEDIGPELLQAIEGSQVFIVVFSKNYASSTWCLRELAKILDCKEAKKNCVLPVFYDVDPSEVRKQSGNYEKAFVEHDEKFKENLEMMAEVRRWRDALTQVASLSGWDLRDKPQFEAIEEIVAKIIDILGHKFSSLPNDLVGISSRVEELEKLLDLGSDDSVRVIGIRGMGGIGKTTLARALYDKISRQYESRCYIDDVSKIYDYGMTGIHKEFLCQALNEKYLQICNLSEGTSMIRSMLRHVKAFIVLDNVDQSKQLDELGLNRECLGAGSRIIIISRDEHILREYVVDQVYDVQVLTEDKALQLFCRKAFKCDDILRDYEELTYDALKYANGLPLAIKVLGSFLFDRDVSEWRSALASLRENPSKDIMDVLRISFDALGEGEKQIFLDIACFFHDRHVKDVKNILDCCGFYPDIGISVLVNKSLIAISNGGIKMHDLLQELGKQIVRENSPKEPGKWSRLWLSKDFSNVMLENTENKNTEAIQLTYSDRVETLTAEPLSKMSHLRFLIISVKFSGSLNCLSNEVRYLEWTGYPFTCLPLSFQPIELVELHLRSSSIKHLWKGIKYLPKLKTMDLSYSKDLIKMPDFTGVQNLERLELQGCTKLVRIHPSIGLLRKLRLLSLENCKNLVKIPSLSGLSSLRVLSLGECTKLVRIHPSIGLLRKLRYLNLKNCKNLVNIPNLLDLSSLIELTLSGCSKAFKNQLLDKPRQVEHLKKLDIRETAMQSQSTSSILEGLMMPFHFFYSRRHKYSPSCLLSSLLSFPCLLDLDLSFCSLHQIPDAIGQLYNLRRLNLGGNNFDRLPSSLKELSKLRDLTLEHCKQLKYLLPLPSPSVFPVRGSDLEFSLNIFNCTELDEMMAFAWMVHALQLLDKSSVSRGQIDLIISGSQIPRWFNNQCAGSSMRIDPTPILHDNNWIGIACCFEYVVIDGPTSLHNPNYESADIIALEFTRNQSFEGGLYTQIRYMKELVTVGSHHQWLLYLTKEELFNDRIDDIVIEASGSPSLDLHLEVKNCGYRWVFEQDLEQLNLKMMHGGSSSSNQILDDLGRDGHSEVTNSSVQSP